MDGSDNLFNFCFLRQDRANVFISETGFKVSVEDCKCAQMNAFVSKDLFEVRFYIFRRCCPAFL